MASTSPPTQTAETQLQTKISTVDAFPPAGPYSQAILIPASTRLLFISGQVPGSPTGEIAPPSTSITEQTSICMRNLSAILAAAAASSPPSSSSSNPTAPADSKPLTLASLVKTTVFLASMDDFKEFNLEYERWFENVKVRPARSCIQVGGLPFGVRVEIEGLAIV